MSDQGAVARAANEVRRRVADACARVGRDPGEVRIIAVTKGFGVDAVEAALSAGLVDIGESRVQEAQVKIEGVGDRARWHMIGHLQTNKARRAARLFSVVHSVDGERVSAELAASERRTPLEVLIQVDYTAQLTRSGVVEADVEPLARALEKMPALRLSGLMTIAPKGDAVGARDCFVRLRVLRDRVALLLGRELPQLSMGMSEDFESAVEEGATMIRVGRVLFGSR